MTRDDVEEARRMQTLSFHQSADDGAVCQSDFYGQPEMNPSVKIRDSPTSAAACEKASRVRVTFASVRLPIEPGQVIAKRRGEHLARRTGLVAVRRRVLRMIRCREE